MVICSSASTTTCVLQPAGFALAEVLIAMVVLGIGLLGAGSALVANLQASRETLLILRAADLAADLGEALTADQPSHPADVTIARWRSQFGAAMPAGTTASVASVQWAGAGAAALPLSTLRLTWPGTVAPYAMQIHLPPLRVGAGP